MNSVSRYLSNFEVFIDSYLLEMRRMNGENLPDLTDLIPESNNNNNNNNNINNNNDNNNNEVGEIVAPIAVERETITSLFLQCIQYLGSGKFLIPFLILITIKFFCDNFIRFIFVIICSMMCQNIKVQLKEKTLINSLCKRFYSVFFLLAINSLCIFIILFIVKYYEIESLTDRLSLKEITSGNKSFIDTLWLTSIVDITMQYFFLGCKMLFFFLFWIYKIDMKGTINSILSKMGFYWIVNKKKKNIPISTRENNSILSNLDIELGFANSINNPNVSSIRRGNSRDRNHVSYDHIPTLDSIDDDATDEVFIGGVHNYSKASTKIQLCVDLISLIYRSILPIPLWLYYLSVDKTANVIHLELFPCIYMSFKCWDISRKGLALYETLSLLISNKLEYGKTTLINDLDCDYTCPICFDKPNDAVTLDCNHIFCNNCINEWLDREKTCPVCRYKMESNSSYLKYVRDEGSLESSLFSAAI